MPTSARATTPTRPPAPTRMRPRGRGARSRRAITNNHITMEDHVMADAGYYRDPTISRDTVVFVCEDDLWTVHAAGGIARRLTANPGTVATPALSPDGATLAFVGRDEGSDEVYVMPAAGGPARRLTYLGAQTWVTGWSPDGASIIFASNTAQPFVRQFQLYAISPDGGDPA